MKAVHKLGIAVVVCFLLGWAVVVVVKSLNRPPLLMHQGDGQQAKKGDVENDRRIRNAPNLKVELLNSNDPRTATHISDFWDDNLTINNADELEKYFQMLNEAEIPEAERSSLIIRVLSQGELEHINAVDLYQVIDRNVEQTKCRELCLAILGNRLAKITPGAAASIRRSIKYDEDLTSLALGHAIEALRFGNWDAQNLIDFYSGHPAALSEVGRGLGIAVRDDPSIDPLPILDSLSRSDATEQMRGPSWEFLNIVTSSNPSSAFSALVSTNQASRLLDSNELFAGWASSLVSRTRSEVAEVLSSPVMNSAQRARLLGTWINSNPAAAAEWFESNISEFDSVTTKALATEFREEAQQRGDIESVRSWSDFIERSQSEGN